MEEERRVEARRIKEESKRRAQELEGVRLETWKEDERRKAEGKRIIDELKQRKKQLQEL